VNAGPVTRASERRAGRRVLVLGAVVAVIGIAVGGRPIVPLYDGVVPTEAYRWLDPPPGQHGDPQGAEATIPVTGGSSPLVTLATPELVPQAQLFAVPGALNLPSGSTEVRVQIAAVEPPGGAAPPDSHLAGNDYRFTVTNQAGVALRAPASAQVTIVLRAPDPAQATATLARFDGAAWQPLTTTQGGGATFVAVVTDFGEFGVFVPGPAPSTAASGGNGIPGPAGSRASPAPGSSGGAPSGIDDRSIRNLVLGGAAAAIVVLVAIAALAPTRRRTPPRAPPRGSRRR
jgi:hypothetical protein